MLLKSSSYKTVGDFTRGQAIRTTKPINSHWNIKKSKYFSTSNLWDFGRDNSGVS